MKLSSILRTPWHRLLGVLLEELLVPLDITVLTEVPVITEPPKADIILLRRESDRWTEGQKSGLADGLRDTQAKELLIEFKYSESLNEKAFLQILVYDYLYSENQKLNRNSLQSFLISASTPSSGILGRLGFKPTEQAGVYTSQGHLVNVLQVILLNELADTPHNAAFKCFASRKEEQKKAFDTISGSGSFKGSDKLESLIFGLRRILMQEAIETPDMGWTPESVMRYGREWVESMVDSMPPEELFKRPGLAKVLEHYKADIHDKVRKDGLLEGRKDGLLEGRKDGLLEGRKDGEAKLLLRLLTRRFGILSSWVHDKVNVADLETLDLWGDRVLDARTLDDIFGPNQVH